MQILKANNGKSIVTVTLEKNFKCISFYYSDENLWTGVPMGVSFVVGTEYTLDELNEIIIDKLKDLEDIWKYDFLIIYTNMKEKKLYRLVNY